MEEKKEYTIQEVIQLCINDLRSIKVVPIDLIMPIGLPISRVIHNLETCLNGGISLSEENAKSENDFSEKPSPSEQPESES